MTATALLADVLANPDDVHARLVYADWLQTQSDPIQIARGELISLQCTIEQRLAEGAHHVDLREMTKRAGTLLDKHKKEWTAFANAPGTRWHFARGFIESVEIDLAPLTACVEELLDREPLRHLQIRKLHPGTFVNAQRLEPILTAPGLARISSLSFKNNLLLTEEIVALTRTESLRNLRTLDLAHSLPNAGGDRACAALAASTALSSLEWLRLMGTGMTDDGLIEITKTTALPSLKHLDVGSSQVGDGSMRALANPTSSLGGSLKAINLCLAKVGNEGAIELLSSTKLTALERLDLSQNALNDEATDGIIAAPLAARLKVLYLKTRTIRAASRKKLSARFGDRVDHESGMHLEEDA